MYPREFLLQFQSVYTERPEGLPPIEVILGHDDKSGSKLRTSSGGVPSPGTYPRNSRQGPPGVVPGNNNNNFRDYRRESSGGVGKDNRKGNKIGKTPSSGAILPSPVAPLAHNPNAWRPSVGKDADTTSVTLRNANGYALVDINQCLRFLIFFV